MNIGLVDFLKLTILRWAHEAVESAPLQHAVARAPQPVVDRAACEMSMTVLGVRWAMRVEMPKDS